MNHDTPLSPRSLRPPADVRRRVLSSTQLRALGITAAETSEQCRPGGGWLQLLPGVYLLRPGPATGEERLHAALRYAARPGARQGQTTVPAQQAADAQGPYAGAMVTGLAALALHGFACTPALSAPAPDGTIDLLVPRTRRLRSAGFVRIARSARLPEPRELAGIPVAPVPRALADAVERLTDSAAVHRLLTEAVGTGHCEPTSVVRELNRARLLNRPHVVDAVDSLLARGRELAEDLLYRMVHEHGLPDPVWNVDLRLPGGPRLGAVDAYWPAQAVALELDTRAPQPGPCAPQDIGDDVLWGERARLREHLEGLGVTVVHVTPRRLRDAPDQQATVVRTALAAAADRAPAAYVTVLPR